MAVRFSGHLSHPGPNPAYGDGGWYDYFDVGSAIPFDPNAIITPTMGLCIDIAIGWCDATHSCFAPGVAQNLGWWLNTTLCSNAPRTTQTLPTTYVPNSATTVVIWSRPATGSTSYSIDLQLTGAALPACTSGVPKTGAPTFFTYEQSDVLNSLNLGWTWLTLMLAGLPTSPQYTVDFCATMPPTDLMSSTDYALLTLPSILTPFTGVYGRLGNQVKADKWNALCQCPSGTVAPPAPVAPTPPAGMPTTDPRPPITNFTDLSVQLHVIDRNLEAIYRELHSFQRFTTPYDFEEGTVHTPLSGTGSIALGDRRIIGIRYALLTSRPGQPVYAGNPPYMWNQGWLSIDDDNGMLDELRVTRMGAEWFPERALLATSVNWALDDGVTMRLTELYAAW